MIETAQTTIQFAASMVATIAVMGGMGIGGAWLMTRGQDCNPYGHDACACGCGTDCGEAA